MPVINWIPLLEIECDYPGCDNKIILEDESPGNMHPNADAVKARGWIMTHINEECGGYDWFIFCSDCKKKELPTDLNRENHNCIFMATKKNGEPANRWTRIIISRCVICDRVKEP